MNAWKTVIEDIHVALFRRKPMAGEVQYWRQHFEAGGSVEKMRRELASSNEFEYELRHHLRREPLTPHDFQLVEKLRQQAIEGKPPFAVRKPHLVVPPPVSLRAKPA